MRNFRLSGEVGVFEHVNTGFFDEPISEPNFFVSQSAEGMADAPDLVAADGPGRIVQTIRLERDERAIMDDHLGAFGAEGISSAQVGDIGSAGDGPCCVSTADSDEADRFSGSCGASPTASDPTLSPSSVLSEPKTPLAVVDECLIADDALMGAYEVVQQLGKGAVVSPPRNAGGAKLMVDRVHFFVGEGLSGPAQIHRRAVCA